MNSPRSHASAAPVDEVDVRRHLFEGQVTFLGIELLCGPGALVPRPATEALGLTAIERIRDLTPSVRVIDMCCGTGNLACAIATHVPDAEVWACDLTDECVDWTRRNVARLGLGARVSVMQGDLFQALAGTELEGAIDVIVCNPPYIPTQRLATDPGTLLEHEPLEAFHGGPYGLTIHQRLVREAPAFLRPGGWLFVECGLGQHRQVEILLNRTGAYASVGSRHTRDGKPRVVAARLKER